MTYVGIDVSKHWLDLGLASDPPLARRLPNTPDGIASLVAAVAAMAPPLVALEATGVYHLPLVHALLAAAIPVSVLNPAQVSAFRQVTLGRTKTDRQDALLLARLAHTYAPELRRASPRAPVQHELRDLVRLREALLVQDNRLTSQQEAATWARQSLALDLITEQRALLAAQRARVETAILALLATLPEAAVVQRLPGVGPWTAATVLAEVPAELWGQVKPAAAFVGVQPAVRQSGGTSYSHLSKAGPSNVRRVLYLAAMTAVRHDPAMTARYERHLAAGKPRQVALGACMHAMLRHMMGAIRRSYNEESAPTLPRAA